MSLSWLTRKKRFTVANTVMRSIQETEINKSCTAKRPEPRSVSGALPYSSYGYELVSELRSAGYQIPVLMITAKGSFDDMRQGFLSGSDDYMVKPVNVNEMVLRVGALLRRAQILNEHKIVIGSTEFDYDAMTVTTDKESLVLPKKEFLLLYKLAASPGRTFTKQQLMDEVWGYETEADPHTIEVHIGRIRERLKDNPDFEIVTMRGIGYKVVKK